MKPESRRPFINVDAVREGDGLGAARGIAIGGLVGAVAWLLVALGLSIFLSCA
jgi:hypothetical protein